MKTTSRSTITTPSHRQSDTGPTAHNPSTFSILSWLGMCTGQRKPDTKSRSRSRSQRKSEKIEHGWLSPNFGCSPSPSIGSRSARSSFSTLALDDVDMKSWEDANEIGKIKELPPVLLLK